MDLLVLRLIHIGAAAFWVGAVFAFFLFVQPAAMAVGPDATKFTYQLLHHKRFGVAILASAVVLNLPVFLIEILAIGRTLAPAEALACIGAFLLMGTVFGLGFVWNYQDTAI